ncbi:hypothetical protein MG293_003829 [Ovis ammon polii]|uniref:EF-hand domain-containing protein n=1 Tax=Ovis ammon polii TaxID=230172 RepID=A0AAD4UM64_OVIAM|nr:hypothetical protein MG293_003829 [Ovis ammon polii]
MKADEREKKISKVENKEIHDTDLELKVESRLLENRGWDDGLKDPERPLSECQDEGSGENKKMAFYDFSSCPAIHSAPLPQPSRGQELTTIHDSFLKLCPPGKYYKEATLTVDQVSSLPALRVNPFRDRICRVFSHNNVFSFEDVLGMASVFSEQACPSLKIEYAFRIYADFNENGFIDEEDLQRIILRLLNSDDMSEDLLTDLTSHVLNESDLDNDNMLSFSEFEHAMAKSPDFMK